MSATASSRTRLIISVVPDHQANAALEALIAAGFGVTRIASTGGFLHEGNTTLVAGVDEGQVEPALAALRAACGAGKPAESREGGKHSRATVFVIDVAQFEKL